MMAGWAGPPPADSQYAARVDVLMRVAAFDAVGACWDAKDTSWAARPFQLDPDVKPLFPVPAHPSYPPRTAVPPGA
jgi:hypothetical protein